MIWELDLKLEEKIRQRVEEVLESEQVCIDECQNYFDLIRQGSME
jgi:hypothetical protein